jgi:hypothetical protein
MIACRVPGLNVGCTWRALRTGVYNEMEAGVALVVNRALNTTLSTSVASNRSRTKNF